MRRFFSASAGVGAALMVAGAGRAQSVDFRIVERQGQTSITTPVGTGSLNDAVLNFSVQARVVGGAPNTALGNFQFNVHVVGEPEANGTLARLLISNTDGTYAPNTAQSASSTVGRGGLAAPYTYLAGITGGFFNGLINISGGNFTNGPDQEILAITGSPVGYSMLLVTDANQDGNPDTFPGAGTTAPLDPAISNTYFATNGNWIDVYRFKYTVTNLSTPRVLEFTLDSQGGNVQAQVFTQWGLVNSVWGPANPVNVPVTVSGAIVPVMTIGPCCDNTTGSCSLRGLGDCANGAFVNGSSCSPSPCPAPGACCQRDACSVLTQAACGAAHGQFRGNGEACLPPGSFNACCVGNFDGAGGLQVQDIFAFLSAWFVGDLRADIDQNGLLSVYDIFAFLGAWSNGCG